MPERWRSLPAEQQPAWPDLAALDRVVSQLAALPPLVSTADIHRLGDLMSAVSRGEAFVLQGGDCAETFCGSTRPAVRRKLATLARMAAMIGQAQSVPVVLVGRIAGQYAKPRSTPIETRGHVTLPCYRGDAVNGREFTPSARVADPDRLLRMYHESAQTLRFADDAADVLATAGWAAGDPGGKVTCFTSHEALLLDYESALTRPGRDGRIYDTSAHMVWIGERTRDIRGAHVAFACRIGNPVQVKLGSSATPADVVSLAGRINPGNRPGRLSFVTRLGAAQVRDLLPELVDRACVAGIDATWICDPMHANTRVTSKGRKTRLLADIMDEVAGFFDVHRALGTYPGGLHLEMTGDDVTECLGGSKEILPHHLGLRYETACDPRLNYSQACDLAAFIQDLAPCQIAA